MKWQKARQAEKEGEGRACGKRGGKKADRASFLPYSEGCGLWAFVSPSPACPLAGRQPADKPNRGRAEGKRNTSSCCDPKTGCENPFDPFCKICALRVQETVAGGRRNVFSGKSKPRLSDSFFGGSGPLRGRNCKIERLITQGCQTLFESRNGSSSWKTHTNPNRGCRPKQVQQLERSFWSKSGLPDPFFARFRRQTARKRVQEANTTMEGKKLRPFLPQNGWYFDGHP